MENNSYMIERNNIRKNIITMVYEANSGHIGGALSGVDILTELYFNHLNLDENNINSSKRDRFVLSKGHASALLYAVLHERGLLNEDIKTFRALGSNLQGHPNMNLVPGVEISTGSLGQGFSCAVGMALSFKMDNLNNRVYCLVGDGEIQEGQIWEACMAASHFNLDNMTLIVDNNGLQIDGNIDDVMSPYPLKEKFESFNFDVIVVDGHCMKSLNEAFIKQTNGKPKCIICKTVKGCGVSFMENNASWHGTAPSEEQYLKAMAELEVY